MSLLLLNKDLFVGFSNYHIEQAYFKSVFEDAWEKEPDFLYASCTRFREEVIANPYLFRYWQFAKNLFYPKKRKFAVFQLTDKNCINEIEKAIYNTKFASICLNDSSLISEDDFHIIASRVKEALQKKYPDKSSFEV